MNTEQLNPLNDKELEQLDDLDLDTMDLSALRVLLDRINLTYPLIAASEPAEVDSEDYLIWQENLEMLDDFIDELNERLC